jgi:hypothetical protein
MSGDSGFRNPPDGGGCTADYAFRNLRAMNKDGDERGLAGAMREFSYTSPRDQRGAIGRRTACNQCNLGRGCASPSIRVIVFGLVTPRLGLLLFQSYRIPYVVHSREF